MDPVSSTVASVVLILFVIFGFAVVVLQPPVRASLIIILVGALLLPVNVGFDFPLIPLLGRRNLPYLLLLVGILLFWPNRASGIGFGRVPDFLAVMIGVSPFITSLLNQDGLRWGPLAIGGLTPWDGVSASVHAFLDIGLPFYVGRIIFKTSEDLRRLMTWLVAAALIYSLGVLIEIRLSPQLHNWVYGYHPNEFYYNIRWGGFRPMVFLPGGIAVALFLLNTTLAAFSLGTLRTRIGFIPARVAGPYLLVMVVLCKSLAAIFYSIVLVPLVALLRPLQLQRVALLIAALVLIYPMLRTLELVPTTLIVDTVSTLDAERGGSLSTRFENDERLLRRNLERILFGWGAHNRGRIFDEITGIDISLTDGWWMILMSTGGLLAWGSYYLLLLWPVLLATRRLGRLQPEDQTLLAGIVLILSVFAFDQLFNGFYLNMCFVISGGAVTFLSQVPRTPKEVSNPKASRARRLGLESDSGTGSLSGGLLKKSRDG